MSMASVLNQQLQDLRPPSLAENLAPTSHEEITAGNFHLDVTTRKAYFCENDLALTSAEFDVLRYLISHRKRLVTPQTVLSTAYDPLGIRRTDFLKALLSLKKKLDEASGTKSCLHVEPWVVYEFDVNADR